MVVGVSFCPNWRTMMACHGEVGFSPKRGLMIPLGFDLICALVFFIFSFGMHGVVW